MWRTSDNGCHADDGHDDAVLQGNPGRVLRGTGSVRVWRVRKLDGAVVQSADWHVRFPGSGTVRRILFVSAGVHRGQAVLGERVPRSHGREGMGRTSSIGSAYGRVEWAFHYDKAPWAGTLATSGGLVFAGDEDGYLMALDAKSGKLLWHFYTGSRLVTAPVTYLVDGKQYVAMPSGGALLVFANK